jgi:hypothetical protein
MKLAWIFSCLLMVNTQSHHSINANAAPVGSLFVVPSDTTTVRVSDHVTFLKDKMAFVSTETHYPVIKCVFPSAGVQQVSVRHTNEGLKVMENKYAILPENSTSLYSKRRTHHHIKTKELNND